jgi:hypothetical protein
MIHIEIILPELEAISSRGPSRTAPELALLASSFEHFAPLLQWGSQFPVGEAPSNEVG